MFAQKEKPPVGAAVPGGIREKSGRDSPGHRHVGGEGSCPRRGMVRFSDTEHRTLNFKPPWVSPCACSLQVAGLPARTRCLSRHLSAGCGPHGPAEMPGQSPKQAPPPRSSGLGPVSAFTGEVRQQGVTSQSQLRVTLSEVGMGLSLLPCAVGVPHMSPSAQAGLGALALWRKRCHCLAWLDCPSAFGLSTDRTLSLVSSPYP